LFVLKTKTISFQNVIIVSELQERKNDIIDEKMETENIYRFLNKEETFVISCNKFVIISSLGIHKVQNHTTRNFHYQIRKNTRENLTLLVGYPFPTKQIKYSQIEDICPLIFDVKLVESDSNKLWFIINIEWNKFHNSRKETITPPGRMNNTTHCGVNSSNNQNCLKFFINSLEGNLKLFQKTEKDACI